MLYSTLGSTDLQISQLSLGTMTVLSGGTISEKLKVYDAAFAAGVNYFDTSDNYENGESEKFLGAFIKGKEREQLRISTKCFFPKPEYPAGGLSRDNITQTIDRSLQRMGTDYIDIFYCHRYDSKTPVQDTVATIQALMDQGKVRQWGISGFTPAQLCEVYYTAREMKCQLPAVAQYPYNLFNRTIEMDLKEVFQKLGINVISYYPLSQGVLTGKYSAQPEDGRASDPVLRRQMWDLTESKTARAKAFVELAGRYHYHPAALALKWSLQHPAVCSTLSNVNNFKQLEENLAFISINLAPEILAEIENIFQNYPANPYTGLKY